MFEFLTHLVSSYGYFAVFGIMFANSDFLPTVTELSLPFAGFLASKGLLSPWLVVLAAVLGDILGATIAYLLGRYLEEKLLLRLINKYGKYFLISEAGYTRAVAIIQKRNILMVFFAKLTPGLKAWASLVSGVCQIPFKEYILVSALASTIYNTLFVFLGYYLGKNWHAVTYYLSRFQIILFTLLICLIALGIYSMHRKNSSRF